MNNWTINDISPEDLGATGLVVHLNNQDSDYAEIIFAREFDAQLPDELQDGNQVVLKHGGTVLFRGEIENPALSTNYSAQNKSIKVYGIWRRLQTSPYIYAYPFVGQTVQCTHGIIGGDANGLLSTILSQCTPYLTIGTIDVGSVTIPTTDIYDQTIADTIRAVLRYIPGAMVVFDYSTEKPTINILADNSTQLVDVEIDTQSKNVSELELTPRHDRVIEGVRVYYETTGQKKSGELQLWQQQTGIADVNTISGPAVWDKGFYLVGTETAGNIAARKRFLRTVRLSGEWELSRYYLAGKLWPYQYNSYENIESPPTGGLAPPQVPRRIALVRGAFFSVFQTDEENFNITYDSYDYRYSSRDGVFSVVSSANYGGSTKSALRPLMRLGSNCNSFSATITKLQPSPAIRSGEVPAIFRTPTYFRHRIASFKWENFYSHALDKWGNVYANDVFWIDYRDVNPDSNGDFNYLKEVQNNSYSMPSGIAASLLSANSRLLYDGRATVNVQSDPGAFFGKKRRAVVTVQHGAKVDVYNITPIQSVVLNAESGTARLTFGSPAQLGPQDIISLYRAGKGLT